jgi:hypothetical protein
MNTLKMDVETVVTSGEKPETEKVTREEFKRLRETVTLLRERLGAAERKLKVVGDRVGRIDPQGIEPALAAMDERATVLSRRLQALLLRDCVFTEVLRSVSREDRDYLIRGLLSVWDQSDDWWLERDGEEWSIKKWRDALVKFAWDKAAVDSHRPLRGSIS